MTKTSLRLLLAAAAVVALASASDASAQATIAVSATVNRACTIAAQPIAFGAYEPIGANDVDPLDQEGEVTVQCTKNTAYTVALGPGANAAGGRNLKSAGGDLLAYELYQDAAHADLWTDAGAGLLSRTAPSKAAVAIPVYARIPGNQDVPEGVYADSVVATVNF